MNASMQSTLGAAELAVLLALVRGGNLATAAQLAGVDGSTVFRTVQRAEKALGQRLFERSRSGYQPTELGQRLAHHAERIEAELEAARAEARLDAGAVSGVVRIATADTLLKGLLMPVLKPLHEAHPGLRLDITARNELANLTQREADIALRATAKPPPHVVGRELGTVRNAVFAPKPMGRRARAVDLSTAPWIGVDDAMPDHPSVRWRRKHFPRAEPVLCVNSVQAVFDAVVAGLGVGLVPVFLARERHDVVQVSEPVPECDVQLWLLTHPESRHLRRIATVAAHLAEHIAL
jgi:DNA-binding transcriptional LysR family regulator